MDLIKRSAYYFSISYGWLSCQNSSQTTFEIHLFAHFFAICYKNKNKKKRWGQIPRAVQNCSQNSWVGTTTSSNSQERISGFWQTRDEISTTKKKKTCVAAGRDGRCNDVSGFSNRPPHPRQSVPWCWGNIWNFHVHGLYVLWSARTWLFAALCRGDCATDCCAVLCCARGSTTTYSHKLLLYCCCCILVQRFRPLRSLTKKHGLEWQIHFRCKQTTCKCQELHAQDNKRDAACMYVHASCGTYSDRHVLGLLLCAGGIALCCAVLAVQRHAYPYILLMLRNWWLLLYTWYVRLQQRWKKKGN